MINLYQQAIQEEENEETSFTNKIPSILMRIKDKIDYEALLKQKQKENEKLSEKNALDKASKRFNEFLERNSNFIERKSQKNLKNTQIIKEQEVNECSFKPKTQKFKKKPDKNNCEIIYQGKRYLCKN